MIITKHGYKRIKERLGLPRRAHLRHIKSVLNKGQINDRLMRFIEAVGISQKEITEI
jgi:hypothetical protein